jgi:phospholipase/carboxylesterase
MESASFKYHFVPPAQKGELFTLLLLHAEGGHESDVVPMGRQLHPAAALLAPRGPIPEGNRARWFNRDEQVARALDLATFLEQAVTMHELTPGKVVAVGIAQGATLAATMMLHRPQALFGALLFRPSLPPAPGKPAKFNRTPVFISAGRLDPYVSTYDVEQLKALFERAGAALYVQWQHAARGLAPGEVAAASRWLLGRTT